jgi:acylglycerol lipase
MPRPLVQDPGRVVTWRAADDVVLRGREWTPTGDIAPRGLILFLHGIQSHSGWYAWTCGNLARVGYRVLAPDRRGSGMNEGVRGHAMSATQWIDDTTGWLREAKPRTGQRAALLGVSWGAKLAVATARRHPELVDALALLYPGLYSRFELRWHQRWRLAVARRIGLWHKRIPIPLDDPALFTDEPAWREFIRHDPLSLREMTVGFLAATLDLDELARGALGLVQPLLLMTARRDAIVDNAKTVDWFAQQPAADKTLLDYDGCHTLEFESCREAVLTDLIRWLDRTLGGSGAIG